MALGNLALQAIKRSTQDGPQATLIKDGIMKTRALKLAFLASTLAGLTGTTVAAPTLFTATATVQNAITITQTTPLNFGTIFATGTATGIAVPLTTQSEKLTLSSANVFSKTDASTGTVPKVLSFGGSTVGSYSAPGLPSNGTVSITLTDSNGAAFTNAASAALAGCMYDTSAAAITANKIALVNGADPTTAFFCVDAFTTNRTALIGAGYALGFGVTTLTFDLGATLVQQTPTTVGTTRTYQTGAYTGSFGMEVAFP